MKSKIKGISLSGSLVQSKCRTSKKKISNDFQVQENRILCLSLVVNIIQHDKERERVSESVRSIAPNISFKTLLPQVNHNYAGRKGPRRRLPIPD